MALVAMRCAMAVTMVIVAVAVMIVVMPAATALAMGVMMVLVRMVVSMLVVVMMLMAVMRMAMIVIMMVVIMPAAAGIAMSVMVDLLLRLERAFDLHHRATLPAHQLGQVGMAGNIERVDRHFRRNVMAAEMPGEAHQPQRVLGADFQQAFRSGLDLHEAAILQLQRVAIVQRRRLVEINREFEPASSLHGDAAAVAVLITKAERIDDALGADGGLAKDGSGAKHMRRSHGWGWSARLKARIGA